jgi:hypothetical protein
MVQVAIYQLSTINYQPLQVAAGDGLAPPRSPSKGDVLLLDDPALNLVARQGNAPCSTD